MIAKFVTGILLPALFLSCNSTGIQIETPVSPQAKTKETPPSQTCYRYTVNTDTILLNMTRKGDAVTGTLIYHLDGKDKNTGTLKGLIKDDILLANYSFMSEGIRSVRQVAFKLNGSTAVEGFQETGTTHDTAYFRDINSLEYNNSMVLTAVVCK
ncbi:MAG: hypothetical protein ABIT05_02485 [Chitinophagaceae bacterium]